MVKFQLAAAVAALVFAGAAQSAAISWGVVTNISGDADVSTNGTLVNAWNFGSASSTTVNGVLFQGVLIPESPPLPDPPIQVLSHSFGPHTLSTFNERFERTLTNFATGSAVGPFTALSGAYQALLGSAAGTNFGDRDTDLLLGGLTIGRTYEFQAWFNDSDTVRFGLSIAEGRDAEDALINDTYLEPGTQVDGNGDPVAGGTGQWVIGTFTADDATQALLFVRGEVGGGLNGFQLRELSPTVQMPLPGTLALVGAALFAAGAVQRRQRRAG